MHRGNLGKEDWGTTSPLLLTWGGLELQERAWEVEGVLELLEHPPECGWSLALLR